MTDQAAPSIDANDIAIIGMSGRFPGANTLEEFWENLKNGVESISFLSEQQLLASGIDRDLLNNPNYVKACGSISDIDRFDAQFFNLSPREAAEIDPQQRLFLECAWEAIEGAGYNPEQYEGAIAVYAGSGLPTYLMSHLGDKDFIVLSMRSFEQMVGNDKDYLATRVAYKLNLTGPAINVQTACSTSLVAVHLACQSLLSGECDMALAGGVSIQVPQEVGYLYQEGMILSPDGHCRAFDANARGTVFGNGLGVVLLKRLEEAIGDRDIIYAVIKGSAINNDGSLKLGYTAPSVEGQAAVIAEAQSLAEVEPSTITYLESHGTGTALGDPIEVEALTRVFATDTAEKQFSQHKCALGSLKTNVGHLNTAAGVAALIKTVLCLKHQTLVPSLNFETPNPQIDFEHSPFYVNTTLSPWKTDKIPRRAGVSSFGVGGTNAHMVLQEYLTTGEGENRQIGIPCLFTVSAKTPGALVDFVAKYIQHFQTHPELNLEDVCYTANTGKGHYPYRQSFVVSTLSELTEQLQHWQPGDLSLPTDSPQVVFQFSQGVNANTGAELYHAFPVFADALKECDALLNLDIALIDILYAEVPQKKKSRKTKKSELESALTEFSLQYALAQLWQSWGIEPDEVVAEGIGECVARAIAGKISLADSIQLAKSALEKGEWPHGKIGASRHQTIEISSIHCSLSTTINRLGQLYEQGITIDWSGFYPHHRPSSRSPYRKVELPTYPFQRQRYWIEPYQRQTTTTSPETEYSLLGQKLTLPFTTQVRFQTQFTPDYPSYVKDHRYYGQVVVAGASHIVMGILAGQQCLGSKSCVLENIEFRQILGGDQPRTVQVVLERTDRGTYQYQLISGLVGSEDWVVHATATIRPCLPEELSPPHLDLGAIKSRCTRPLSSQEYYAAVLDPLAGEFSLGPTFQWTEAAWLGEGEGLIKLKSPESDEQMQAFFPHPGMVDAGIVPVALLSVAEMRQQGKWETGKPPAYAFMRADSFRILASFPQGDSDDPAEELYYYTKVLDATLVRGNSYLVRASGEVVAEFIGIDFRELSQKVLLKSLGWDWEQWYYEPTWRLTSVSGGERSSGTYLILAPDRLWGDRLAAALAAQGNEAIVLLPSSSPVSFPPLANFQGILHLWSIGQSDVDTEAPHLWLSVLALLQSEHPLPPLWLVTQGAQPVADFPLVNPAGALLWGLGKVIALEHPELSCRCIDLDPTAADPEADLVQELLSTDGENQVAYRGGQRYGLRMVPAAVAGSRGTPPVREDATYLITGGWGALGLAIAQYLTAKGARHLVLTGRSAPSATARETITTLEQQGTQILAIPTDLGQEEQVKELFAHMAALPPLKGVVHAAGIIEDGLLRQMSGQKFQQVLAPKVQGTWYLHQLTQESPLDFFVMFSSITSLLGSPGQGNYTAANAYLDAIAHYRRSLNLPALSINWGPFAHIGIAARLGVQQQTRLADQGIQSIPVAQGLQIFSELLASEVTQIAVFPVHWPQLLAEIGKRGIPPLLSEIASQFDQPAMNGARLAQQREFLEKLARVSVERREILILEYLTTTVAKVLRRSPKDLPDPEEGFFNLGLDSLMTLDLAQKIQSDLGISLSSTATFEYPNLRALATYVHEQLALESGSAHSPTPLNPTRAIPTTNYPFPHPHDLIAEISQLSGEDLKQSIDHALNELYQLL